MIYKNYQKSRDIAWKILLEDGVSTLPISVSDLCKKRGIFIVSYKQGSDLIRSLDLAPKTLLTDAFTLHIDGKYMIFYNDVCSNQRNRFSIGHELGHILLGHLRDMPKGITTINREPSPLDDPIEQQANVFAARILSPACVLWGLGVQNQDQIQHICDISYQAARFRMDRLQLLYDREKIFLKERGYSCFLMSPLEQKVYAQFETYIKKNKL